MSKEKKSAKPANKAVRRILIAVAAVAVVFYVLTIGLGIIIKHSVQTVAPMVAGVEVEMGRVLVNPFTGALRMRNVRVGSPEGFDADMFTLGSLDFSISIASVLQSSKPIRIREISVVDPVVTYELKGIGLNDNLHALLNNLGAAEEKKEEAAKEEEAKDDAKAERKVIIDHFLFKGGRVKLAVWEGNGVPIPLPAIELKGIGEKSSGVTGLEATADILTSIVTGTVKAVGSGAISIGGSVKDLGKGILNSVTSSSDGDSTLSETVDGIKDLGKGIGDAASGVSDALGKGIGKLFK